MSHKAYPTILQALLLSLLLVGLQLVLGTIAGFLAGVPGDLGLALINAAAFGLVILLAARRSAVSLRRRLLTFDVSLLFLLSLVTTVIGLQILVSELDNALRTVLPLPEQLRRFLLQLLGGGKLVRSLLLLVVIAPLTEETLVRGIFLPGFLANYSTAGAVVASALFFAALHLNPWQFPGAFLLGLYLGLLYTLTRSLSACMLAHALNNAIPLLVIHVLRLRIRGFTPGPPGQAAFQPWWLDLSGAAFLALGAALSVRYFRRRRREQPAVGPVEEQESRGPAGR